ncbi:MAG: aminoacyl-tRNA hydrolase [Anaerolineae bacterium]|nr:MAG: aminoacyl-tRNA hydrolase [Anaerolineae bacterium]WKZ45371.1 MAG: alternative ribosome rescue aminoacyl-tRNA hydrolase ArfB [Anaerolineales bacterium]
MLEISPSIKISENELRFDYVRASGPGGQNVNKVATAVQLRFDVRASSLPEDVKTRLLHIAGKRATSEGIVLIEAKHFRTQEQNREDAIQRLVGLLRKAAVKPRARKKTKPSKASKEKRLQSKKQRGEIKRSRQSKSFE